jgi:hypothetical protein
MPMTGSDTRMYSPRSESMLGYTKDDDDYKYGVGDPKEMDKLRDQKQSQKEAEEKTDDLPHLKISIPKPAPEMPPMMPEEEEEPPMMDDQFNEGQQFGAMTGMPDMGNLSLGAATGTMPAPGGMLATGEPMEDAWSTLLKEEGAFNFSVNDIINTPRHTWYSQIMGRDTPMVDTLVDNGIMPVLGYDNHHYGDPGIITDFHEGDVSVDDSLQELMNHRNSLMVLDARMQGKEDAIPQEFRNYHNNFDVTRMMENEGIPPHIQAAQHLAFLYSHLNYLGHKIGPQMGEADDDFNMKYASEPMEDAWSTLMKSRLDDMGHSEDKSWKQPQYKIQPGGADISTATSRRSKLHSRFLKPSKKRGLDKSPLAVHRSHLGIETKQPLRLFPRGYDQQMGTMQRRKLMGNVPVMPAGHAMGAESAYNPKSPSMAASAGLPIKEPRAPRLRGQALAKSELQLIKSELEEIKKKKDYMQFAQIRRLLRQLKDAAERQERRLKAASQGGHGKNREVGHREGQDSTTRPEGATEDMENDPKNWGAPSTMFAARGSGRVG